MKLQKKHLLAVLFAALTMCVTTVRAQVTIGSGEVPHTSALLDLKEKADGTSNKGFLGPRVALSSPTDQTTIPNPAVGLLVYNNGTGALKTEGYLYWNGNEWMQFTTATSKDPQITALDCSNARINPVSFKANEPYEGVLIVPYTGGNGGYYPAGDPITSTGVNGLIATLQPGNLAYGNGELVFTLSGTPDKSSPEPASFDINFLGQSCTATITGDVLNVGEFLTGAFILTNAQVTANAGGENLLGNGNLLSNIYPDQMPILDGLMMDLEVINATFYRPIVVNISSNNHLISLQTFATSVNENKTILNITLTPAPSPIPATGRGSLITTSADATTVPAKYMVSVDNNNIVYWTTTDAEVITTNLQVQINATTYRWYEFKWWSMQIGASTAYEKKIFFSVQRKA